MPIPDPCDPISDRTSDRKSDAATAPPDAEAPPREVSLHEALGLAQQLQREERFAEAESLYLQLLERLPDDANVLHFFGVLRHQQGRQDEALALLELALRQQPESVGIWVNLANVLIEHGLHDDAVQALRNAITLDPSSVMAHNNLGILHTRRDEFEQAEAALLRAVALGPQLSYVHYNLARVYFRTKRYEACARHNMHAIGLHAQNAQAYKLLSRSLVMMGRPDDAAEVLHRWAQREPDSPEPTHYLAALGVTAVPERASDNYVQTVFDRFAESFDVQLEKLGYQGPQIVCAEFERLAPRLRPQPTVLDAGCGTGLCGPLLKPLAGRLEGVDLSAGMLRRAQTRGDYAALHQAELTAFLQDHPEHFDAVVSADVLIYFGHLSPVMAAVHRSLRPGGLLVASLECLEEGEQPVMLQVHGRYSHASSHVCEVLRAHGLSLIRLEAQVLRHELLMPVRGLVFSARKES